MAQFVNYKAATRKPMMVTAGMFPVGTDLSWILSNFLYVFPVPEQVTGTADGVNTTFYLSSSASDAWVFVNGLLQQKDVDYVLTGATGKVEFSYAPPDGAVILASLVP